MVTVGGVVLSEGSLAWYLTDSKHWWPSVVEEIADSSCIQPEGLPKDDQLQLYMADLHGSSIFRVTLLGKKTETQHYLSPDVMGERLHQPFL